MIDNSQPLAELHDIVAAPAAHWWPLAPAWYVLILVLVALVSALCLAAWRWQQRRRVRNAALKALRQPLHDMNAITLVLKQACLGYFPAQQIAALSGPDWFTFLAQQLPAKARQAQTQALTELAQQSYQPPSERHPSTDYQQLARYWLRHALPPRSRRHD